MYYDFYHYDHHFYFLTPKPQNIIFCYLGLSRLIFKTLLRYKNHNNIAN